MSHNTFGHLFRVTTWGESHGPALGCVVDGTPPGLRFKLEDIQVWLDKRKPGQSRFVTQRREADLVKVLSGIYELDGDSLKVACVVGRWKGKEWVGKDRPQTFDPKAADVVIEMKRAKASK